MIDRRGFLGALAWPATAAVLPSGCWLTPGASEPLADLAGDTRTPEAIARDEDYWARVQSAFTADRSMVNLNNGGVCPAPAVVQAAMKRYLDQANEAPAYVLWRLQDPQKETVRAGLAQLFGCDPEEVAITRNASESLENVQQGFDLSKGDEVLTTDQDYPRMLTTWKQRERRDGIVLRQIQLPVPCEDDDEIVKRFEQAFTPRTKVLHVCHVINLHGMVLPVKRLVQLARSKGVPTIIDGAHSFAHMDFKRDDIDCDYFGTSLHKFLFAPHGTGMLYVRREKIGGLWPLMAAGEQQQQDIRKFEEIGTHPLANYLAISEALAFHEAIGPARKQARQLYLRDHWALRLSSQPRFKLHTSLKPGRSSGVALVEIEGVDSGKLNEHLWNKEHIFTVAIGHPQFQGLRISPTVYTRLSELDRFCAAMEKVAKDGLPPRLILALDYLPAVAHASGPGRYARELVRALVRLPDAPEIGLYEVGRARRVVDESELGLEGARVRRLSSRLPRRLRGPADRAFGGVEIFHRILPGTPRLARARTTIALAELPPLHCTAELARASAVFVFCEEYRARVAERFGIPPGRIQRVPVGCEHWRRRLAVPPPRADPPRVVALASGDHGELRAAIARLSTPARPLELVLARERGIQEAELPALIASASALVHLVPEAGTAVTPLEALSLGTPVVVPRLPAFEEALGQHAFWAEPLDEALEAALASAADPEAKQRRVAHSQAFSWERSAREHLAVWLRMTAG